MVEGLRVHLQLLLLASAALLAFRTCLGDGSVWDRGVVDGERIPRSFHGSNFLFSDCCLVRPGYPWASNSQALLIFDTCYPLGAFVSLQQMHLAFLLHNDLLWYFLNLFLNLLKGDPFLKYHP